jgi:hypothetical protein
MNKILIAAIAATTMTAATAGVEISGNYEGTFTEGNPGGATYAQDLDLKLVGTVSEGTNVTATFEDIAGGDTVTNTQLYITTTIEGLDFKGGTYKSQNGKGLMQKESAAAGQFEVSTKINGYGVSVGQTSGDANATADVSANVSGVAINVQNLTNTDRFISASVDTTWLSVNVERQKTLSGVNTAGSISTTFGTETQVFDLTSVIIDVEDTAGITQDDGILGDISDAENGKTVSGVVLSTNTPMGMMTGKYIDKNDLNTYVAELERGVMEYSYTKTENTDGVVGASITVTF